jgi:hypothetical protein
MPEVVETEPRTVFCDDSQLDGVNPQVVLRNHASETRLGTVCPSGCENEILITRVSGLAPPNLLGRSKNPVGY